jgi:hypothetical protein
MDNELKELLKEVNENFIQLLIRTNTMKITNIHLYNIGRLSNNYNLSIKNLIIKLRALRDKMENG